MRVLVKVQPRSSKRGIIKLGEGSYKVCMHEAAINGHANAKLVEMMAGHFAIKKSRVRIVRGLRARNKVVEINL